MEIFSLNVQPRTNVGKTATKAVRAAEQIPCVLYGGKEVLHFSTTLNDIRHLIYTPDFKVAEITLEGKTHRCIVKEIQFHPVTDAITHVDFLQLVDGQSVKVDLPVRFTGTSPGVKSGGKLLQKIRRVRVKVTPEALVDQVTIDISGLDLGQSIRVRDIKTPKGMEILNSPGIPVATVEVPRALRSATTAAEKAAGKK